MLSGQKFDISTASVIHKFLTGKICWVVEPCYEGIFRRSWMEWVKALAILADSLLVRLQRIKWDYDVVPYVGKHGKVLFSILVALNRRYD